MRRRRERRDEDERYCGLCAGVRPAVLFESWAVVGLLRRRQDVAWRWECQGCGARTTVPADELAGV